MDRECIQDFDVSLKLLKEIQCSDFNNCSLIDLQNLKNQIKNFFQFLGNFDYFLNKDFSQFTPGELVEVNLSQITDEKISQIKNIKDLQGLVKGYKYLTNQ